jgi:hypothetical protein
VGNTSLYIMRNDDVVWGGILWSRSYSSTDKTMAITGVSFDAYAYYRRIRKTVKFGTQTDRYTIARMLLRQMLNDFTITGTGSGEATAEVGGVRPWTGWESNGQTSRPLIVGNQIWPDNANPNIELPPLSLVCGSTTTANSQFRGYNMDTVGGALEQWCNTDENLSELGGFEYRIVCWYDETQEKFRQCYQFGRISGTLTEPTYVDRFIGQPQIEAGNTIFDFPGHVSDWSLAESMENAQTRTIALGAGEDANKIAEYAVVEELLSPTEGAAHGWLLYDGSISDETTVPSTLKELAKIERKNAFPPRAAQLDDLNTSEGDTTKRTSRRATDLTISLYVDPTTPFPAWGVGDWVTFAIADPFYGGRMYLQRRIIKYTVTVTPDHESDFSHEQISLELTDTRDTGADN